MVSQAKGGCKVCSSKLHTKMYHNEKKPLKRTAIKRSAVTSKAPVKKKKRTESRGQLVKKLDSAFSQYIRLREAVDGEAICVTCGLKLPWKQLQCGHYETRGDFPTRWDETNCHPQCVACNVFRKGNYTVYARYMIARYGADKLDELAKKAKSGTKITTPEIREMIETYKMKVSKLDGK